MRQVEKNPELTTLGLPKLKTVRGRLYVRARPVALARLIAPAAARIAPSLPTLLSWRAATRASGD